MIPLSSPLQVARAHGLQGLGGQSSDRVASAKGPGNPTTSRLTTILSTFWNFWWNIQARQCHPEERTNWKSSGKAACASSDLNKLPARTSGESKLFRPWKVNLVTYPSNLEYCTQKGMQVKLFDVVSPLCRVGLKMDHTFRTVLDPWAPVQLVILQIQNAHAHPQARKQKMMDVHNNYTASDN